MDQPCSRPATLPALGRDVTQVPPVYARPFRQSHKNDFRDAHAMAEAVQRPDALCTGKDETGQECRMQASNSQPLNFCTLLVGVCALVLAAAARRIIAIRAARPFFRCTTILKAARLSPASLKTPSQK